MFLSLLATAAGVPSSGAPVDGATVPGVVVERIAPGSAAEHAGLRPGDRLVRWRQETDGAPDEGVLASPFDLLDVELERAPRGPVTLAFERDGEARAASLWPDDWGLEVRPDLPPEALTDLGLLRQPTSPSFETATQRLRGTAAALPDPARRLWLALQVARAEAIAGRTGDWEAALAEALREAGGAAPGAEPHLWTALGRLRERQGRAADAGAAFSRAIALGDGGGPESLALAARLEDRARLALRLPRELGEAVSLEERATALRERAAPKSLAQASGLCLLGRLTAERGDIPGALERLRRGAALAESLAPESAPYGRCAYSLAYILMASAGLDEAEPLLQRALTVQRRRDPDGPEHAASVSLLGVLHNLRGDPHEAERLLFQALALRERSGAEPLSLASTWTSLGVMAKARGDLAEAERRYQRALSLIEGSDGGEDAAFAVLNNLGNLARVSRDLAAADGYLRRALAIQEGVAPESLNMSVVLANLGAVALDRGDLETAERFLRRALRLDEAKAPGQVGTAFTLQRLADVLLARGNLDEAEQLLERALAICETQAPAGDVAATALHRWGILETRRGRLAAAEERLRAALAIRRERFPDSEREAESSHALGAVLERQGRREEALTLFRRSVEAIQAQSRRLGGSQDARAAFRAHHHEYHRRAERLLLELGRPEEAFAAVEASRSRTLLALMAARDLDLARDVPAELERERRRADAVHDGVLRRLGSARDAARTAELRRELEAARQRQDEVRARIRGAAPRLAEVRDPQPLDLEGVRKALDPGTLLLAYSIGEGSARLYAVGPAGEFSAHTLAVPVDDLAGELKGFLDLIRQRRSGMLTGALDAPARRLGGLLLGPVGDRMERAERLLVVPDGLLHLLPFAALRDPRSPRQYLVERKPVHVVSSVTLYTRLARPRSGAGGVVGFGDPRYPGSGSPVTGLGAAVRSRPLTPLPWTRAEVASLDELAPGRAQLWLGAEATEERAKSLDASYRVVHFASHGFLDDDFPLESGLALAIPADWKEGRENGFLQAWEIFERLRLDADLVTLSACQTGVGKELAGEGLMGLTWAFQYAGVRSVLASLWEVGDASTADLMRRFYRHLAGGVPKAEALRRAQVEMLRRRPTSSPYAWAPFQLVGDWR